MDAAPALGSFSEQLWHREIQMVSQTVALSILCYEYAITLPDEIERVWHLPWSGASILFLLNRYITIFIVTVDSIMAFNNTLAQQVCEHWVKFQGWGAIAICIICETIMILRIYALFGRNHSVLAFLSLFLVAQFIIQAVYVAKGTAAGTPLECILVFPPGSANAIWEPPLVVERVIFACTIWRAKDFLRKSSRAPLLKLFLRDGTMYYLCILLGNVGNTVMFSVAPGSLKAFFAPLTEVLISVMVSRLVLNLRRFGESSSMPDTYDGLPGISYAPSTAVQFTDISATTPHASASWFIGNLGEPVEARIAELPCGRCDEDAKPSWRRLRGREEKPRETLGVPLTRVPPRTPTPDVERAPWESFNPL